MRKIPEYFENPIDNILLKISDKAIVFFKNTGHTPNIITTYSFITGLLALYFLYNNKIYLFVICFSISYFFDCVDGHMARTYNMVTKYGDFYDHFTDAVIGLGVVVIIFLKYKDFITTNIIILFIIFFLLMNLHIGCQQKIYKKLNISNKIEKGDIENQSSEFLDIFEDLCLDSEWGHFTKYFGVGTYHAFIIVLIFYLNYQKNINMALI